MSTTNMQINKISKMKNNYKFNKWFTETWNKVGGLITYSAAAEIIGCSRSYISKLINEEKLIKHQYLNTKNKFIARNEVLEFKSKINYEKDIQQEIPEIYFELAKSAGVSKTSILKEILKSTYTELIKFKERQQINKRLYKEKITELKKEKGKLTAKDAIEAIKYTWQKGTEQIETKLDNKVSESMINLRNKEIKNYTSDITDKNTIKN